MATSIDQAFIKQFEAEVFTAYQRMGSKLRPTVRSKNNIVGATTVFQKVGKGVASTKSRHGNVPVMNVDHTAVEVTLQDYYAGDWIDKLDELKTNIDERSVIANLDSAEFKTLIEQVNASLRTEAESSDPYVRRMRPTFGYIMAFTWAAQMLAIAAVILDNPDKAIIIIQAMDSLDMIWTVGLSVLGIYVYKRSQEKNGVARLHKLMTDPAQK